LKPKRLFQEARKTEPPKQTLSLLPEAELDEPQPSSRTLRARSTKIKPSATEEDLDSEEELSPLDFMSPRKTKAIRSLSSYPSLSDNRVIQTPMLRQLNLGFQVKYELIVCMECEAAIPFDFCVDHATNATIIAFVQIKDKWVKEGGRKGSGRRHNRPYPLKGSVEFTEKELLSHIAQELESTLGQKPSLFTLSVMSRSNIERWAERAVPHPDQRGPVAGLKVYPGLFQCTTGFCKKKTESPFLTTAIDRLYRHNTQQHNAARSKTWSTDATCQTFSLLPGLLRWFCVSDSPNLDSSSESCTSESCTSLSISQVVKLEREELLGGVPKNLGLQTKFIDPAYVSMGISRFWTSLDMETIQPLLFLNSLGNAKRQKENQLLQKAVIATFVEITGHVPSAHPTLRHLINKGS
jgi:hypothetical protein